MSNIELMQIAKTAQQLAYAPYSNFKVGAVILTDSGSIFSGGNIENSSYGATICAERCAVCKMIASGEYKIKKLAIIADTQGFCAPCGMCLQVLSEFMNEYSQIILTNANEEYKILSLADIFPR